MTTNPLNESGQPQDVFIGGDVDLTALTDSTNISGLLATGRVGFYSQDGGIEAAYDAGTLSSIVASMANSGPGEAEINIPQAAYSLDWFQSWWQSGWLDEGLSPNAINAIINYDNANWYEDFESFVQTAKTYGVTTVAPIYSPNVGGDSLSSFATSPGYAQLRAAALLGGGLTVDAPPSYFFARGQSYQSFVYGEIQWAQANHLRVTVLISANYHDSTFMYDTQSFVKMLEWNNAIPTQWVIENYTPNDLNGIGSEANANSIAGVALWVAENAQTTSEPAISPPPTPTISVGAPGTMQEALYGAGVSVTVTIHATYLAGAVYWGVMTAQGWVETPQFYAVDLDANGNATITAHIASSGDYIDVASNLANPSLLVSSAPITITEPQIAISLPALGVVQEAAYGDGVTVTETIHTTNIAGPVYWGVMTAQGWVETPQFYAAPLDANGNATITAHLDHTGDYVDVATSLTNPALLVSSAPITITEPQIAISLPALGVVQEAAYGDGVTVTETIHTTNIAGPVYWGVMTAQGWVETPQFYAAPLDANGNATITAHLDHTGDYVDVATSLTNPALLVSSAPITITEPQIAISLPALGVVQEAAYGDGVTVTETIHTTNIAGPVYWGVMTAQGWVETPQFYAAPLDANGNATITAHLDHTGDYVDVATSLTNPALLVSSAPITITEPQIAISLPALGVVQEAAYGDGVTVTETIHTTNIAGPVYWGVMTAQGWVETPQFYAAPLDANGNATITAHLDHTGDYVDVATSLTNPALLVSSAPITITEPAPVILTENGNGLNVVKGDGIYVITGNASNSSFTLGNGNQSISLNGDGNDITIGSGSSTIAIGPSSTVHADGGLGNTTTITATGASNTLDVKSGMTFLNTDGSASNLFMLNAPDQGLGTINGFNMAVSDVLDLSRTLAGLSVTSDLANIGTYVTATTAGGNTTLLLNPTGGQAAPTAFAVLTGLTATVDQLIKGDHITLT